MKKLAILVAFLVVSFSVFAAPPVPDTEWIYKTVDGKDLVLSVFLPEGYEAGEKFPVYVAFHGGSWNEGSPAQQFPDCAYWARRGMVGVSAEYRLKDRDRVEVPLECVKDAKSAIRFLRANAARLKIDPARVVVAGESAGGQMAAATAMIQSARTNGAQDDLSISCRPDALILFNPWFKCAPELSPPAHVTGGLPPVITFLGDKDVIPLPEIREFHESLLEAGGDSMLLVGHGGKHGFCNGQNPANPFFYWSMDHVGRFLEGNGILPDPPAPAKVPEGVKVLAEGSDYTVHSRETAAAGSGETPKPNFVLVLADDLGWQDVGCYDIDQPSPMETPNIDRLAKLGILFRQGYSPAPTCAPTRCAIMSGNHPARALKTHVEGGQPPHPYSKAKWRMLEPWYSGRMPENERTLARVLRENGYATGHVGKWHMAMDHFAFPQPKDQGFEWSKAHLGSSAKMRPHRLTGFATEDSKDPYRLDKNGFPRDQTTEDALDFIRGHMDRPFFLYHAPWMVHTPVQTRSRALLEKYAKKLGVELPANPEEWSGEGQTNPFYCAMVEEFDYHVGRLVALLETTDDPRRPGHKLIENTYIIFTSDNGGMEGVPGEIITDNFPLDRGKISLMEGGTRVPFLVAGPGIEAGLESDVMVNGLDFYPTILSLAGIPRPEGKTLDGSDLSRLFHANPGDPALVTDADGKTRDTMVWHFPNSAALESSIRVGDYKLVRNHDHVNNPKDSEFELYRLYRTANGTQVREDIEESKNLAADMPDMVRVLNDRLTATLTEMKAAFPHYNPQFKGKLPHKENVPVVTSHTRADGKAVFAYEERGAKVARADLIYSLNGGKQYEEWFSTPAAIRPGNLIEADLPAGTTHYFINLIDEHNFLVSHPDPLGDADSRSSQKMSFAQHAIPVESSFTR